MNCFSDTDASALPSDGDESFFEKYCMYFGELMLESTLDKRTSYLIQNTLDYMTKLRAKLATSTCEDSDEARLAARHEAQVYLDEAPGFLPARHPAYAYDFDYLYRVINVLVKEGAWRRRRLREGIGRRIGNGSELELN